MSVGDARLASEGELVFGLALYLAMNAGAEVSRDAVAHLLWPSHGTDAARHCLRQLVYRLRALGVPLAPSGDTVDLPADRVIVDAHTLFAGEPSRQAYLQIERFDVLPDYAPTFSKPFSLWLEQVREQLCVKLRHGLMACIADARARGRYREVSQLATHCLSLDPLNEEATLGLAEAAALAGNKVRALRILDDYRADLGASPTLTLQTDILRRRIAERLNVYGAQPDDVPMVGREDAVEYLLRGLHAMSSGVPQQLLIIGEPGVGKTRLLSEFQKIAAVHGVRPVVLRCHPGWDDQPLTAITELASTLLQLPGALGCSPDAMLALRELTSGTTRRSDSALYATDGEAVLANLRWAVLDLVEAVMQERHLVLMIDNLQWLDPLSESFLTYIIPRCHAKPLYVILTMREEDERRDGKGRHPLAMIEHRMTLAPLDDTSARQLVHEVLDLVARSLSEAAIHACIRRCGGNPYFLSELTKFLLVAGPDAAAPVTLRTFIEFRLGKVSRSARRALQAVGILGRFATAERIRRILQSSGRRLMDSLEELQIAGLVQVTNNRCECRHDVVREIVVGGMSGVARRVLHLRAAREFKRDAQTTDSPTLLLECGRHLLLSGDTVRAPRGALFLARRLHELGAAEHAEELARSAFDLTSEKTTRSMGLLVVARALRAQGKWRALAELRESVLKSELPGLASDSRTEILIHTAEAIVQLGAFAETDLMYLVQLSEDTSLSWKLRLLAARLAATVADNKWNPALGQRIERALVAIPPQRGVGQAALLVTRVILTTMSGDTSAASKHCDDLLTLADSRLSPSTRHTCYRIAAHGYYRGGDLDSAGAAFRRSLELSASSGSHYLATLDHVFLTLVYTQSGELEKAREHVAEARLLSGKAGFQSDMLLLLELLQAEVTVEGGEVPRLRAQDFKRQRAEAIGLDPRAYQSLLAVRLLQSTCMRKWSTMRALLDELTIAVENYRGCGWQDFPFFAIANALVASGDTAAARLTLGTYLRDTRRERSPLRPRLKALVSELGLT